MEKEILKKASQFFANGNEVKYDLHRRLMANDFPVEAAVPTQTTGTFTRSDLRMTGELSQASSIDARGTMALRRRMKELFANFSNGYVLGSRMMMKNLRRQPRTRESVQPGQRRGWACQSARKVHAQAMTGTPSVRHIARWKTRSSTDCPKSSGQVYTPYTCKLFDIRADGTAATDIEHIVALAEAYDSGLAESQFRTFAGDLANLTLADPDVNRSQKSDRDAGDWGPPQNSGWFAARVVAVKQKYGLAVNPAERNALQAMLNSDPSRTVTCGF